MLHPIFRSTVRIVQRAPQRRPQIRIKRQHGAGPLRHLNGAVGGAADRVIRHGQRAEMEDPASLHQVFRDLVRTQHHVSARTAVKREVAVPIRQFMDQRQRRRDCLIKMQPIRSNTGLLQGLRQHMPKVVFPNFSDKRGGMPQFLQHRQHIARRSTRIGFKQQVSLGAGPILRQIDQQLPQRDHIICFFHFSHCSSPDFDHVQ